MKKNITAHKVNCKPFTQKRMPNWSLENFSGEAEFSIKNNLIDAEEKGEIRLNYSLKYIVKEFHGIFGKWKEFRRFFSDVFCRK